MAATTEAEYRCKLTWSLEKIGEEDKEPMNLTTSVWAGPNYEQAQLMQVGLLRAVIDKLEEFGAVAIAEKKKGN